MFKKKIVFVTNYARLEMLLGEHFPELEDYCFVSDQEAANNTSYSFTVDGLMAEGALRAIKQDRSYNIALDALNVLCARQIVEPGEYLVEVSW